MADYTRNWLDTVPPGTRVAKEIDDAAREFRVDVHERMLTVFDSFGEDKTIPVVLKSIYSGAAVSRPLVFGPHLLKSTDNEDDVQTVHQYVALDQANKSQYGQIPIPVGYVITKCEVWMDPLTKATVTTIFSLVDPLTGTVTALSGSLTRSTSGIGLVSSAVLSHTMINPEYVVVQCSSTGGSPANARIYGFRVLVTVANNSQGY